MYFATYTTENCAIEQVLVRLPLVVVEPEDDAPWHDSLRAAWSHVLKVPGLDFAYRLQLRHRRLERLLFLSAPAAAATELERIAGAFQQLNAVCDSSAGRFGTREEHDEAAASVPAETLRVAHGIFKMKDRYLMHDFRFFPLVETVFLAGLQSGWELAYQVNARHESPPLETQRLARKNLAALQHETSLPEALLEHQAAMVAQFGHSDFMIDEFLCCDDPQTRGQIVRCACAEFKRRYAPIGFDDVPLEEDSCGDGRDYVVTGLHPSWLEPLPPLSTVASAIKSDQLCELLCWEPPRTWKANGLANVKEIGTPRILRGATVINQGTMDFSQNKQVQNMNTTNISVTLGNGVTIHGDFVVANRIRDSFAKAANAPVQDELKTKLQDLATLVGQAIEKMPSATAEQASQDLQALVAEASSSQPRRRWYDLSAQGLIDAAKSVGEMAAPITAAVRGVLALLGA